MPKQIAPAATRHPNPLQALSELDPGLRADHGRLAKVAPMPLDAACLNLATQGAVSCARRAVGLLPDPKPQAIELVEHLEQLNAACVDIYKDLELADSLLTLRRRLGAFPAWRALATFGELEFPPDAVEPALLGMELLLKLAAPTPREIAPKFAAQLALTQPDQCWSVNTFIAQYHHTFIPSDFRPSWYLHGAKIYQTFVQVFSTTPPPPPPPPTFDQRSLGQMLAKAAWPKFRARASILDHTMLSAQQVRHCAEVRSYTGSPSQAEAEAIRWLAGFGGVTLDLIPLIPCVTDHSAVLVLGIDIQQGLLIHNFSGLADDQAAGISASDQAQVSTRCIVPMPADIHLFFLSKISNKSPATAGDLLPTVLRLTSRDAIFPYVGKLTPSWARWARTIGPYLRQNRLDNLLVALITGDFGNTAKSKLYYCRISHSEIWQACTTAYKLLEFGAPVSQPAGLLDFGTPAAPTIERVARADCMLVSMVNTLRPPNRWSSVEVLFAFHNAYTRAMAFRLMLLLGLREAQAFCILADFDELADATIDIDDKTTRGLQGALPVALCCEVRRLISDYRAHCQALARRLAVVHGHSVVVKWLNDVANASSVPLLCFIGRRGYRAIGTSDVLADDLELAPDFGRKVLENQLRTLGVTTRDTDRQMRHEVLGQESYTSVSAHSLPAWAARISPALSALAVECCTAKLQGMRSSS